MSNVINDLQLQLLLILLPVMTKKKAFVMQKASKRI